MAQVIWSRRALADVANITNYIGRFNPFAAQRMASRLYLAGDSLMDAPARGRWVGADRRELAVVPPYVIRYRVGEKVVILSVRHTARRPLS